MLHEFHTTPSAGHSGLKATMARLATSFYWPRTYHDTKTYIKQCLPCQQNKPSNKKPLGLLQPIPIPAKLWEELTIDFITHLPSSFGHTVIWVVCDRLSKSVHFIALPISYNATQLAHHFSIEICRLHGVPKSIIFDRDPLFLSHFWKEPFHL